MNLFRYKLIDASGKINSGVVTLPYGEVLSAIAHLERDGAVTIYVKKLGRFSSWLAALGRLRLHRKLSRNMQAEVLNNLALMLRSGVSLVTALKETAESAQIPGFAADFNDLITRIQGGASFSEAAGNYPHIFPESVIHLIKIGEETGQLDKMLKDASEHLKRIQVIISDTKQALLYPAFVFVAIGAGLIFWFYFVVPKIVALFEDMDVALPAITLFLVRVSDLIQNYFFHILIGVVAGLVFIATARKKNRRFKKACDALLLKLPIVKTLISASALAFITEYFALLIAAGIDILQSVKILEASLGNEVYREKLAEVGEGLSKGEGIAENFRKAVIFPPLVVRMIGIGEVSGTLSEQLAYIAEEYRHKLTTMVATMGKMIEPLVLIFAGVIFAIIIVGLFLPIYDLVTSITAA
jgi:type II secretory pathway component PulF